LISRIENEQFAKSDSVSVKELFEDVMEDISHRLEEKEISFSLELNNDVVIKRSNRDLLYQLIYNLINNAIKYNKPKGSIKVSDSYKGSFYQIFISDTGIGIPSDDIPTIFNRFKKSNLSEGGVGYGLGLSIVQSIANYHKIKIDVSSVIQSGTTFTLLFPKEVID